MKRAIILLLVLIAGFIFGDKIHAQDYVPDQLVCQLNPGGNIYDIDSAYNTVTLYYLTSLDIYLLQTEPGADVPTLAAQIATDPDVFLCEPNYIFDTPEGVQSSQPFLDNVVSNDFQTQPAVASVQIPTAQTIATGTGVKVAVVDVGINMSHPQLSTMVTSGFDFVSNDSIAADEPGGLASGHGTFIAGVISLVAPDAELVSYRVLDTTGRGNGFTVAEAVIQAVQHGCKVINLSMVMDNPHVALDAAIEYARDNNVMVVAAAGNDSLETDKFPFRDSYTLGVAAVDSNNVLADFSNFGGKVDVCAPGTHIFGTFLDTTYARWDGTSFATPFVAGQAALLYAKNPGADWSDIREAIMLSAVNIDAQNPGMEGNLGAGLIDLAAALNLLSPYICGDVNNDQLGPDIADIVFTVDYMFGGGPTPAVMNSIDVDASGFIDVGDLVYFVEFSFHSGPNLNCP
ncbi:MAG: hypothetical protein DWP97_02135 [Calditrichaeota bacterium]|nr:MAG: hypothetical protein DWP97_02135 [Calditrichota bacterium]